MKKEVVMITNENYHDVLKKRRDFTTFVFFSSKDERYGLVLRMNSRFGCGVCDSLEATMELIHSEYYKSQYADSKKVLFAIARYEDSSVFYDKVWIMTRMRRCYFNL